MYENAECYIIYQSQVKANKNHQVFMTSGLNDILW